MLQDLRKKCIHISPKRDIFHNSQRIYRLGEDCTGKNNLLFLFRFVIHIYTYPLYLKKLNINLVYNFMTRMFKRCEPFGTVLRVEICQNIRYGYEIYL